MCYLRDFILKMGKCGKRKATLVHKRMKKQTDNRRKWRAASACFSFDKCRKTCVYGRRRSSLAISAAQSSIRSVAFVESAMYASGDSVFIVARSYTR